MPFRLVRTLGVCAILIVGFLTGVGSAMAAGAVFTNPVYIDVPDPACNAAPRIADPYPLDISVSGVSGFVSDVNVTLTRVDHAKQGDLEILLVGPGGRSIVLLSDAGTGALTEAPVTFDDSAAAQAPQSSAWGTGTYKPTNYSGTPADSFPSPAPVPSASTTLASAFNGISPNGTWSLYVVDDACNGFGFLAGGYSLDITTSSLATPVLTTTASASVALGGSVSDTATLSEGASPTGTITFRLFGPNDATCSGAPVFTSTVGVSGNGTYTSSAFTPATAGTYRWIASYSGNASNAAVNGVCNAPNQSVIVRGPRGDANGDGQVQVSDVFYLVNFLFAGGTAPVGNGDANGVDGVTVADVFYLISFLFAGGAAPPAS